jgi:hypothetical protein
MISSSQQRIINKYDIKTEELHEFTFAGLSTLESSFPNTHIRPETLTDKLTELISPIEVGLKKHKEFSKNFFVLTENKEHLKNVMNFDLLDTFNQFKSLETELNNKKILVRNRTRVDKAGAIQIINLLGRLHSY